MCHLIERAIVNIFLIAMNIFKNMVGGSANEQDLKADLKMREGQIEKLKVRLKKLKEEK